MIDGGKIKPGGPIVSPPGGSPTLKDLGLDKKQAARAAKLAALKAEERARLVEQLKADGNGVTPAAVLAASRQAAKLKGIRRQYMHDCGLYSTEDMRPINETRMVARWKLGAALKQVERGQGLRNDLTLSKAETKSFRAFLADLDLDKTRAMTAQRISALPEDALRKLFAIARDENRLLFYNELVERARPYWYKASRETKHRGIHAGAVGKMVLDHSR